MPAVDQVGHLAWRHACILRAEHSRKPSRCAWVVTSPSLNLDDGTSPPTLQKSNEKSCIRLKQISVVWCL
jgi:hypothetical protein